MPLVTAARFFGGLAGMGYRIETPAIRNRKGRVFAKVEIQAAGIPVGPNGFPVTHKPYFDLLQSNGTLGYGVMELGEKETQRGIKMAVDNALYWAKEARKAEGAAEVESVHTIEAKEGKIVVKAAFFRKEA